MSTDSGGIRPSLTFEDIYGPGRVYCPRASLSLPGWLPQAPGARDASTGSMLSVQGGMPGVASSGAAMEEGLEILAESGVPVRARIHRVWDPADTLPTLRRLSAEGLRLAFQFVHPPEEVPPEAYWIPPDLLRFLNHKASLDRLVPAEFLPERKVLPLECLRDSAALLANGPVALKAASSLASGGGNDVRICRTPADAEAARGALAEAESIVVERLFEIRRDLCVQFAILPSGEAAFLGAAEQITDAAGRYKGNWFEPGRAVEPEAIEAGRRITEKAAAMGYRGIAGFDMAFCADGRLRVYDLNFRVNGSTAGLLLQHALAKAREFAIFRSRAFRDPRGFGSLLACARAAVRRGLLVPLGFYDPRILCEACAPRVLAIVGGGTREEIAEREKEIAGLGLLC